MYSFNGRSFCVDIVKGSSRLTALRGKKSIKEVHDDTGISGQSLRNYEEAGKENPVGNRQCEFAGMSIDVLCKLSEYYGVSPEYILGLSDMKSPSVKVREISKYTGLSEAAIEVLHNMNSGYRTALMPLFEDPSIEAVGGYIAFALWSVIHADTSDRKPWDLPGGDDISFFEDGSIRLSSKEAAKSHIDRATRHIGNILESSIINAWNHPELYMEGDSNAKESKQESER